MIGHGSKFAFDINFYFFPLLDASTVDVKNRIATWNLRIGRYMQNRIDIKVLGVPV